MATLTAILAFFRGLFEVIGIIDRAVTKAPEEKQEEIRRDDKKENDKAHETGRPTWKV